MHPKEIRRIVLEQSKRAHVGHIGCALSVADIIAGLHGGILRDLIRRTGIATDLSCRKGMRRLRSMPRFF